MVKLIRLGGRSAEKLILPLSYTLLENKFVRYGAIVAVTVLLFSVVSPIIPTPAQTNLVRNGDFSEGLNHWTTLKVNSGYYDRGDLHYINGYTAGPSLHILIKLLNTLSLVFVPLFLAALVVL